MEPLSEHYRCQKIARKLYLDIRIIIDNFFYHLHVDFTGIVCREKVGHECGTADERSRWSAGPEAGDLRQASSFISA